MMTTNKIKETLHILLHLVPVMILVGVAKFTSDLAHKLMIHYNNKSKNNNNMKEFWK